MAQELGLSHDQGVCIVDDYVANEWAYIPHFYGNFYVFQYATSFTASSALSERVISGEPKAAERYLKNYRGINEQPAAAANGSGNWLTGSP